MATVLDYEQGCILSECQQFLVTRLKDSPDMEERHQLLKSFYYGLIVENFPFEDELDPFESWEANLELKTSAEANSSVFEVLLFFDKAKYAKTTPLIRREILGGSVVEFFPESKCGLLSYFVVSTKERGRGLAKQIIKASVATLQSLAKEMYPELPFCPVFAETNDPNKVAAETDSLTPNVRLGVLHNLGFGLLDCQYVQPPLSKTHNPCSDLLLTVFLGTQPRLPYDLDLKTGQKKYFLPTSLVYTWVEEFWLSCCRCDHPDDLLEWDEWYEVKEGMMSKGEKVPILDLRIRRKIDRAKL